MTHALRGVRIAMAALAAIGWQYAPPLPPRTSATITLLDDDFRLSHPLSAGRQVIHVRNADAHAHDMLLARIAPGKSVGDFSRWIADPRGTAPVAPVAGLTPLAPGAEADITVDLTPGTYGLICIFPDVGDGRPHYMHGMLRQITVRPATE